MIGVIFDQHASLHASGFFTKVRYLPVVTCTIFYRIHSAVCIFHNERCQSKGYYFHACVQFFVSYVRR